MPDQQALNYVRPKQYRTIWLSDIHLFSRGCQADMLLDFLRWNDAEGYYLVGDIIDFWAMRRTHFFPQEHNDVIQKFLRKARKGSKVRYVPGNHDEGVRGLFPLLPLQFGGIELLPDAIHVTADGKRLLVIHGDQFDGVMLYAKWLAFFGDRAYGLLIRMNKMFNLIRRTFGLPYWSLSRYVKYKVKEAVKFISRFEEALVTEAWRRGCDGVVCGHIHHAELRVIDGIVYANDGDWVESCTALVEHFDGRLELIHWQMRGATEAADAEERDDLLVPSPFLPGAAAAHA
jgi:UDP-2,3-diacylglucosamine pyrophosphatase LpxH